MRSARSPRAFLVGRSISTSPRATSSRRAASWRMRGTHSNVGSWSRSRPQAIRRGVERRGQRVGMKRHHVAGVRVQRHRVALGGRAADDRRRLRRQVPIDDEERGPRPMPRQHVQQRRRRLRVRPIVEGQIDRRRPALVAHLPHRDVAIEPVEDERERRQMHQREPDTRDKGDYPHDTQPAPDQPHSPDLVQPGQPGQPGST